MEKPVSDKFTNKKIINTLASFYRRNLFEPNIRCNTQTLNMLQNRLKPFLQKHPILDKLKNISKK